MGGEVNFTAIEVNEKKPEVEEERKHRGKLEEAKGIRKKKVKVNLSPNNW